MQGQVYAKWTSIRPLPGMLKQRRVRGAANALNSIRQSSGV
jgi:hypothetical protein